jgi:hypothetical protein
MWRILNPFRLGSHLFVFFAIGHTWGAVIRIPRFGAASDAVVNSMQTVHVVAQGVDATWYGFYRGFGGPSDSTSCSPPSWPGGWAG